MVVNEELMMGSSSGMWNGTQLPWYLSPYSACSLLRCKIARRLPDVDSDDQIRLLRRLIKAQNLDEKQWPAKKAKLRGGSTAKRKM
ncbi:hypothetical protein OH492_01430 [Vibrio chagasii]|nr:hypothetical protein [Vibrio chagasii]